MKESNIKEKFKFVEDFLSSSSKISNPEEVIANSKSFFSTFMKEIQNSAKEESFDFKDALGYIKDLLQGELKKICEKNNMSMEELKQIVENPSNFNQENWNALQNLKKEINFKDENSVKNEKSKKKVKKQRKNWEAV